MASCEDYVVGTNMTPMQDPLWQLSCITAFAASKKLEILIVVERGKLLALCSLARTSRLGERYEQVGARKLVEPGGCYFADEASLQTLVNALGHVDYSLALGRVLVNSPSLRAVRNAQPRTGTVLIMQAGNCPYIDLTAKPASINEMLGSHLKSDLRRARRKAEALGSVDFEIIAPESRAQFLDLYEQFLRVEASSWKGRAGTALSLDPQRRAFFREYGIRASSKGILRIARMRIGEETVAMQYAVQCGERFWLLKVGYDEAYRKCSPGHLLMYETLRYAVQQGLRSYEFLGGADDWTRRWTRTERETVTVDICRTRVGCALSRLGKTGHHLSQRLKSEFKSRSLRHR